MADVPIKGRPILPPSSLSAAFSNHGSITAKWRNQVKSGPYRPTYQLISLQYDSSSISYRTDGSLPVTKKQGLKYDKQWSTQSLAESTSYTLSLDYFYPRWSKGPIVNKLRVQVNQCNTLGSGAGNYTDIMIGKPRNPSISASFNPQNGVVTFTVATNAGTDRCERYDTAYWVERQDSPTVSGGYKNATKVVSWNMSTSTSFTVSYDVTSHSLLKPGEWTNITCKAYARGIGGNSSVVTRTYTVAAPPSVSISRIEADSSVNGKVRVVIGSVSGYVSTMKLQKLYNTTIGTSSSAAEAEGWNDVPNAVDNASCTGFVDQKSESVPEVLNHTWYRVVTQYGAIVSYGMPLEASVLYRTRDTASVDAIKWARIAASSDGESVELGMGWATDNYTATEVAWSDNDDSWDSNEQPNMFTVDWEDSSPTTYAHTARFVIMGLTPGVPVYIRARRVKVEDGKITKKGAWCNPPSASYPITPGTDARDVMLYAPSYVVAGDGIDVTWTYEGGSMTRWTLYKVAGGAMTSLYTGTTSTGKCTVAKAKLDGLDSVTLRLGITTATNTMYSDDVTVAIYTQPTLSATVPTTLTAKPLTLSFATNLPNAAIRTRIIATQTIDPGHPDGSGRQVEGDVLWSDVVTPDWTVSGTTYTGTLEADADFIDGGIYRVEAVAVDTTSGLSSSTVEGYVEVEWSHQAEAPDATLTVDSDELSVSITPTAPESAAQTDVCDIYRLSNGRAQLIASGVAFGDSMVDRYAPFSRDGSSLAYRLCTRTVDEDIGWADVQYTLAHDELVIDFEGDRLGLPWGVAKTGKWQKQFTQSARWDGSMPGHWDGGTSHTASLSTYVIEPSQETSAAIQKLARHMGPCFVRLSDGTAFEADVEVDSYGGSMRSPVSPMSLNATEVDLTQEFMASKPEEE